MLIDKVKAFELMKNYGWFDEENESKSRLKDVVNLYQQHWNIKKTGEIDEATIRHLLKPRFCYHGDLFLAANLSGNRWESGNLKLKWIKTLTGISSNRLNELTIEVCKELNKAAKLSLSVVSAGDSEITLDVKTIDGTGQTLAYSCVPQGIWNLDRVCKQVYDSGERWEDTLWGGGNGTIPAGLVILHELGHALGLPHAPQGVSSVMSAFLDISHTKIDDWTKRELIERYGSVTGGNGGGNGNGGNGGSPCSFVCGDNIPQWVLDFLKSLFCPNANIDTGDIPWGSIMELIRCLIGKMFKNLTWLKSKNILSEDGVKCLELITELIRNCEQKGIRIPNEN